MPADAFHSSNLILYPTDWQNESLESIAEINPESLGAGTASNFRFRYIDISSVKRGVVNWQTVADYYFSIAPSRARRVVRTNDILLSTVRPGLQSHTFANWNDNVNYVCSTGFAVLRAKNDFEPRLLFHLVFSDIVAQQLRRLETGSSYPAVSDRDLRSIRVPKPLPEEQRRIAVILDTVDDAIRHTEALIAKLKRIKAGLLHDLLTRGIDENGELRDPVAHPEQFKSKFGLFPKTWGLTTLGTEIERAGGFIQTGPFGSQLHSYEYTAEGVPVIMPDDIIDGQIDAQKIRRIPIAKANSLSRHKVKLNDVVFARRGDLSRCYAISEREIGWLCGTGCLLVRVPDNEIIGTWLALLYGHDMIQRQVLARAVGSTMVNLNTKIIAGLAIAKPSTEEQSAIVRLLNAQTTQIRTEQNHLAKLQQLKQGLMQDLLTGRVRVNNLHLDLPEVAE